MKTLVSISFVKGQQEAIAARMPAEQAHVQRLLAEGAIQTIHIAADRSRVWLVMPGESPEQIQQTLAALPLYPYMELDLAPLLELEQAARGSTASTQGR
jgi:muconolactone delta-isomerase